MLSLRQRIKEKWTKTESNLTEQKDEREVLRSEEHQRTESIPSRDTASSLETRNVEEMPVEYLHFIVDFIGSSTISEAKSVQILSETLKRVKKQKLRTIRVDFTIIDGILKVRCVESNALLLTAPLYAVALCAQEQLRGFEKCFALNITRKKLHMCHVFEARSRLEAASVVRSVAVAFKTIGRLLREKRGREKRQKRSQSITSSERTRTNSETSTVTSIDEALRASQRRHALYREKMDRESSSSSLLRSPRSKRSRSLSKTSPSFLRHGGAPHLSGRHVEFSALSPVPSDSSDNEAKKDTQDIMVKAEVHISSLQMLPSHVSALVKTPVQIPTEPTSPPQIPLQTTELQVEQGKDKVHKPAKAPCEQTESVNEGLSIAVPRIEDTSPGGFLDVDMNFKPALESVLSGNTTVLERYLDDGLSENASDADQRSLLFHAILHGQCDVAGVLLKRGAEVNWEGPDDKTPLHIAASQGNRTATKILLRYGANVRAKDSAFCTPLHLSVGHKQNLEVSHLLVEHGARINENSLQGVRPVDLEPQLKEMQRLLVQSACEAFTADISKSRSNSNTSSYNCPAGSTKTNQSPRLERIDSLSKGHRWSSLCTIPRGGLVKGSPESSRNIRRSESFNTQPMFSPQMGRGKRPLRRSLSFQKCTMDHEFQLKLDARIESNVQEKLSPPPSSNAAGLQRPLSPPPSSNAAGLQRPLSPPPSSNVAGLQRPLSPTPSSNAAGLQRPLSPPPSSNGAGLQRPLSPPPSSNAAGLQRPLSPPPSSNAAGLQRPLSPPPSSNAAGLQRPLSPPPSSNAASMQRPHSPPPLSSETGIQRPLSPPPSSNAGSMQRPTSPSNSTSAVDVQKHPSSPPLSNVDGIQRPLSPTPLSNVAGMLRPLSPLPSSNIEYLLSSPPLSSTGAVPSSPLSSATEKTDLQPCTPERPTSPSHFFAAKTKLKNIKQHSEDSEHSGGAGQRSISEYEDSSYMSGGSHITHDEDPIIDALKSIVLLSGNPECHESLLAYLCLPRSSLQLIGLAHMPSAMIADDVAVLIGNLFNLEGPESRKRSVEAGLIKTVLKLVDGVEPIQSTCLSILYNILDFDNDREYSTALQSIPVGPLLNLLHISDTDSAFDTHATDSPPPSHHPPGRRRKTSSCSHGSYDDWQVSVKRNNSGASDVRPVRLYHKRNSITSMTSSGEGDQPLSSSSYVHGHLPWTSIGPDMHITKNLPRLVATKMLAATTMNPKMQRELGNDVPLTLMMETLQDSNNDIVMHTTAALANVAMNINNHMQLERSGVIDAFLHLVNNSDPRITYHAARGLIYLGHMDVNGIYLFKRITGDDKVDVIFADTTGSEHLYVKGATVEKIVEIATNNPSILWGGARLQPPSPKGNKLHDKKTNGSRKAADDQIVDFLLTMYSGFVHPIILMRLLIHRFRDPWFDKYFDGDPSTGQIEEYAPLPIVHIHLMRIWKMWLDKYAQDFINNPTIASDLSCLFVPMRRAGGPYLPCADSLEILLLELSDYSPARQHNDLLQENHCHHAILYEQCQKGIVSGGQPCQLEDAVYLSALQLYIEDLSPLESRSRQWFFQGSSPDKISVSRIKQSLPPSLYKVKNITKRIKAQRESFNNDGLSERNAKHNYVDFCQSIAGYGCRFFKLKECQDTVSKKVVHINRLFGINPKKVTLLDEKTKDLVGSWQFKDVKRWSISCDNSRLVVEFTKETYEFLLDNKSLVYKAINELLFSCSKANFAALGESDFTPWSKYAEDTEKWGHIALAAELQHQIPDNSTDPLYDGPISRTRAVSCISSARGRGGRFTRHSSVVEKLSTSAPFPRLPTSPSGPGQTPTEGPSFFPSTSVAPVLGATASSISPLSGLSLPSNHQSVASSEELLIGSFHQAVHSGIPNYAKPQLKRNLSRESEGSEPSPTEYNPLDPSLQSNRISPSGPPTRHRYLSSSSTSSSIGCASPGYTTKEPSPSPQVVENSGLKFDTENFNRMFGLSLHGQLLICRCPPDALLPGFNRRNFTAYDLLQHPKELARQITIIDHEYFCAVTADDVQKKVALGTGKKKSEQEPRLLVERVADRFNQLSTWVVASVLSEGSPEKRAVMFENFIETAKQCLEFRNFNAVMAIVVAALGAAPIRRLAKTREFISKDVLDLHCKFEMLMDPKDNYKRYRTTLKSSPTPAVPYFGVYMKDLTFIAEGNPDLLKGGLVNLSKRRQIYLVINEIRKFQKNSYNFQEVCEIREHLFSQELLTEEELHQISRQLEPSQRRYSEPDKESRSFSIPSITRSNTAGHSSGKKLVKSLSIGGESVC